MANECNPSHGYWTYQRLMKERQTPHWWHTPVAPGCLNHFNWRLCMPSTSGSCLSSCNLSLNSAINCPLACSLLFQSEYRKTGIIDTSSIMVQYKNHITTDAVPSQLSWGLLNNSLRFGITSSAKVSRDTILKPCQGKQIQDEARDMMVNILYTLRVFYTASS